MNVLADGFVTLYESNDPEKIFCYTPGITCCPNGRLVATFDLGGLGVKALPGAKFCSPLSSSKYAQLRICTSDDQGETWVHRATYPGEHARPFVVGASLYVLGHCHDLFVLRSDNWGESWSEPAKLTEGEYWHQSACNVHYSNGHVYLAMEKAIGFPNEEKWRLGNRLAPILLRAPIGADLTKRESWTFASPLTMRDVLNKVDLDLFGVPFFTPNTRMASGWMDEINWKETNVVQFTDESHYWYDPNGKTFHLWMRANTGSTGFAAIAKVVEQTDGSMSTQLEQVPSGKNILFVPFPGGHMRFHVLYDTKTRLFWALGTQATDSMTRVECLSSDRYNLPNNERRRLVLHFSRNMIDWCFAGIVAKGEVEKASRHYASMIIADDDLHILSRSGNLRAKSPHSTNMITFHKVEKFRDLVY